MLDIKFIKENIGLVEKNNASRNVKVDLKKLADLDEQRKTLQAEVEGLRNERKKISKTKPTEVEIIEMRKLGDKLQPMEEHLRSLENQIAEILYQIPNLNHETAAIGKDETENKVEETVGEKPKFSFEPKQHFEVAGAKDLIDCESGAKISGSRFYYLKGKLALLERAIMEYGLQKAVGRGFELILPPILVRERAMFGTGFFPADKNEIYKVNPGEDNLFLIGTAEVPLIAMHEGQIFNKKELPKKYCAVTPCFRREAGSYGKDQSGILRVHQFYKVEMVAFAEPEKSWELHKEILAIEKELFNELELPYQVVNICSGDLGYPAAKKYDLEAWLPGQKKYREMTSTSNTTDFQSRRLNIKYKKTTDGKESNILVHTLNGTMVTDRALIAIIENYQQKDGHIAVPKTLRKFIDFEKI
ncbi:serine--tRNA ligase [Candidatus Falkowbacteria bacterium]|nr:serine--tRNA ligase [Candidatus Falkowbacteria bacterium]